MLNPNLARWMQARMQQAPRPQMDPRVLALARQRMQQQQLQRALLQRLLQVYRYEERNAPRPIPTGPKPHRYA